MCLQCNAMPCHAVCRVNAIVTEFLSIVFSGIQGPRTLITKIPEGSVK